MAGGERGPGPAGGRGRAAAGRAGRRPARRSGSYWRCTSGRWWRSAWVSSGTSRTRKMPRRRLFFALFQGVASYRGDAAFRTWLFRIAVNLCLRWKAARRPTEPWDDERDAAIFASATPEAIALGRPRQMEALGHLPRRQRIIFLLKEWEGWSAAEDAGRWGATRCASGTNYRRPAAPWPSGGGRMPAKEKPDELPTRGAPGFRSPRCSPLPAAGECGRRSPAGLRRLPPAAQ